MNKRRFKIYVCGCEKPIEVVAKSWLDAVDVWGQFLVIEMVDFNKDAKRACYNCVWMDNINIPAYISVHEV